MKPSPTCPFTPLPEHKADECPICNPNGWMKPT
jgi:hypothetical protein